MEPPPPEKESGGATGADRAERSDKEVTRAAGQKKAGTSTSGVHGAWREVGLDERTGTGTEAGPEEACVEPKVLPNVRVRALEHVSVCCGSPQRAYARPSWRIMPSGSLII
ncbi:hypothetical protein F443_12639 [Phytophthora nicotianae P1569]|uniref:Uncharacterized protein n=1 Tax=Phytophthora nicotianae P1569 TaxID=1317065 RepID=V9EUM6_PHYNI|nr:hypothetical protein F443_12639 [Phytophthora nicotianae P1569]